VILLVPLFPLFILFFLILFFLILVFLTVVISTYARRKQQRMHYTTIPDPARCPTSIRYVPNKHQTSARQAFKTLGTDDAIQFSFQESIEQVLGVDASTLGMTITLVPTLVCNAEQG
jgi:hypothetical protein